MFRFLNLKIFNVGIIVLLIIVILLFIWCFNIKENRIGRKINNVVFKYCYFCIFNIE